VEATGAAVACHGPMPQGAFLAGLGAVERLHALLAVADDAQADLLLSGARRLMGDAPGGEPGGAPGVAPGSEPAAAAVGGREGEAMGVSYQALAISPAALPPPAPFGAA
jgi:hypothetical protein